MAVLLCLPGLYLVLFGWLLFLRRRPDTRFGALLALALIGSYFGLAGIVTAVLLGRGRRRGGGCRDRH